MRWVTSVAVLFFGCACGSEGGARDAGSDDAGRDAGHDAALAALPDAGPWDGAIAAAAEPESPRIPWLAAGAPEVAAPAPAAPPVFTPCPSGWREVAGDVATCDPWPASIPTRCLPGEAMFAGEGCAPIGPTCPADGWPTDLPSGRPIAYVRAGAPPGGDGTRAAPYARIADALSGASAGTVIALATGLYLEDVSIPAGVAIWGACAAATSISSAVYDESAAVLRPAGLGVEIRNLTIAGERPGIRVEAGASVVVQNVVADSTLGAGIWVSGGTLQARRIVVRDTRIRRSDAHEGTGLLIDGGRAEVDRALFAGNHMRGIASTGDLVLRDVAILDTQAVEWGGWGHGLSIEGGTTRAERVAVERSHDYGIYAGGGAEVTVRDAVVRETRSRVADAQLGQGAFVFGGATLTLERVLLDRNRQVGVEGGETPATRVTLRDVLVRDTAPQQASNDFGYGVLCTAGTLSMSRVWVAHAFDMGIRLDACTVEGDDLIVGDVEPRAADGAEGDGIGMAGTNARLRRVRVERSHRNGIYALAGATALLEDAEIRETRMEVSTGDFGRGILVSDNATLDAVRLVVDGAWSDGVMVELEGARATLRDLRIRDISVPPGRFAGYGVRVEIGSATIERAFISETQNSGVIGGDSRGDPGTLDAPRLILRDVLTEQTGESGVQTSVATILERVLVRSAHAQGVWALLNGAAMRATDVVVSGTESQPDGSGGWGLRVTSASIAAERVLLERNRLAGLAVVGYADQPASGTIADLIVRDTREQVTPAEGGYGAQIGGVATLDVTRALFERNRSAGVWATDLARVTARDVTVRQMRSDPIGVHGEGLYALGEGSIVAERVAIDQARSVAVMAHGAGARVALADATIARTLEAECGSGPCEGTAYGIGTGAYYGGTVSLTRFLITQSALCGAQLAVGGQIDLVHGEVSMQPIGANVQDEAYDLRRLMQDVAYRNNRVNLDAASLPVPGR